MCEVTAMLERTPKEKRRVLDVVLRCDRTERKLDEMIAALQPEEPDENERRVRHVG